MGLLRTPAINCYAINCCPINCYHFCITAVLALLDALSIPDEEVSCVLLPPSVASPSKTLL